MERREFLKVVAGSLGGAAIGALGIGGLGMPGILRKARGNTLLSGDSEVGIQPFPDESLASKAVQDALDLIGGVGKIVKRGDRVVIKPNLCATNELGDDPIKGEITNPKVVEGVIKAVKDVGGIPVVAEGTAGWVRTTTLFAKQIGLLEICHKLGVDFVDLNNDDVVRLQVPDPLVLDEVRLARTTVECDCFVSVPVLKTHYNAGVTLGMKNLVGILSPKFYNNRANYLRDRFHQLARRNWRLRYGDKTTDCDPHLWNLPLSAAIVDLNSARKPDLTVIDGTFGRERQSPVKGALVDLKERTGSYMIIAGFDPVATDAIGASVMKQPFERIPQLRFADAKGLGNFDVNQITVKGTSLAEMSASFVAPYMEVGL